MASTEQQLRLAQRRDVCVHGTPGGGLECESCQREVKAFWAVMEAEWAHSPQAGQLAARFYRILAMR